jgi:hypothetical protein
MGRTPCPDRSSPFKECQRPIALPSLLRGSTDQLSCFNPTGREAALERIYVAFADRSWLLDAGERQLTRAYPALCPAWKRRRNGTGLFGSAPAFKFQVSDNVRLATRGFLFDLPERTTVCSVDSCSRPLGRRDDKQNNPHRYGQQNRQGD